MSRNAVAVRLFASSAFAFLAAACSGPVTLSSPHAGATASSAASILKGLSTLTTIGSTLDPLNGDQNPYGLAIAPASSGLITAGDLVVCNFNDGPTNTQGDGTTIVGLHPTPGATPYRIAQDPTLKGCAALALVPAVTPDYIWATAFSANDDPIVTPSGTILTSLANNFAWDGPWGQTFAAEPDGAAAFYVSNANDGSIVRATVTGGSLGAFTIIATGFSVNHGVPGSILAPSGLTYDPSNDTLYIVDGNSNRIVAFSGVSTIGANGIAVSGKTFTGPSAPAARVIAAGAPLNGPISAALLPNGNLVVGNTLDPSGTNLLIEVSPTTGVVATKNVDTGAGGALFGIAATGTVMAPKIYFNDDNANAVMLLSP